MVQVLRVWMIERESQCDDGWETGVIGKVIETFVRITQQIFTLSVTVHCTEEFNTVHEKVKTVRWNENMKKLTSRQDGGGVGGQIVYNETMHSRDETESPFLKRPRAQRKKGGKEGGGDLETPQTSVVTESKTRKGVAQR